MMRMTASCASMNGPRPDLSMVPALPTTAERRKLKLKEKYERG